MNRRTSRVADARTRPETGTADNERIVRIAPERSQVLTRQNRILHSSSVIEVPENMYGQRSSLDLE